MTKTNTQKITVIGLGYVGLPLAILIKTRNLSVTGYDINLQRLAAIKNKSIKIEDTYAGKFFKKITLPTTNQLKTSDIYIVCVPTPVDESNKPDLKILINAVKSIARVLEENQLVVIESTIYPGLCEEIVAPILNKLKKKYYLAHCPERINPGDKKWNVNNINRVVGGINEESTKLAKSFYESIIDAKIQPLSSIKNAEATKILENTFRDVNIALVNEMAQAFYRMDIDIDEVIRAAKSKPFSFMPHYPGIGVGGHCIAVDPYYMIEVGRAAGFDHELLRTARKINSNMPIYAVNLLQNLFNLIGLAIKDRVVGVYGVAYKPNTKDYRESPSFAIIERLSSLKKAKALVYDPYCPEFSNVDSLDELLLQSEALIVATAHDQIKDINYRKFKNGKIKIILDGRNCLDKESIKKMGIMYKGIGRN